MRQRLRVPPTLRTVGETEDRHATWLELFFDLVFVVPVAEAAQLLELDHSAAGILRLPWLSRSCPSSSSLRCLPSWSRR